jgi:F420-non-reducing hydrogenase iron-sulfur subunit
MPVVQQLLELAGIGRDRMVLRWVSAAEGQLFANSMADLTSNTRALGAFDREQYRLQLAAVERVLTGPRVRWLSGMDRQVTERGNVYNEKVDEQAYQSLLQMVLRDEYQKALILEVLQEGPLSVREMAGKTGLPVYMVSLGLNDLERRGQAELKGYEGSTPKFISLAA